MWTICGSLNRLLERLEGMKEYPALRDGCPAAGPAQRLQDEVVAEGLTDGDGARIAAVRGRDRRSGLSIGWPKGSAAPGAEDLLRHVTPGSLDRILAMRAGREHGINSAGRVVLRPAKAFQVEVSEILLLGLDGVLQRADRLDGGADEVAISRSGF
jgi:hypothetical protein